MIDDTVMAAAAKIRLVIFDIDGVLTDGSLYLLDDGQNLKAFHCHDGLGMKLLAKTGVQLAIITAHRSPLITKRMEQLQVQHVYQGMENKIDAYMDLLAKLNLQDEDVAYVGDDLPDLKVIRRAGLGIAVANATALIRHYSRYTTVKTGGNGAVREVCELIMRAQDTLGRVQQEYL